MISNTSQRPLPRKLLHLPQRRAGAGGRSGRRGRGLALGGQVSRDWWILSILTVDWLILSILTPDWLLQPRGVCLELAHALHLGGDAGEDQVKSYLLVIESTCAIVT